MATFVYCCVVVFLVCWIVLFYFWFCDTFFPSPVRPPVYFHNKYAYLISRMYICDVPRSRWVYVGGPFAQDIEVNSSLFVLSPNSKYLVSGGHWDNSFRVHSVEKSKLSARIAHHNGMDTTSRFYTCSSPVCLFFNSTCNICS